MLSVLDTTHSIKVKRYVPHQEFISPKVTKYFYLDLDRQNSYEYSKDRAHTTVEILIGQSGSKQKYYAT